MYVHTHTHTLAECAIHLLLVLWDRRSAWGCQFSLPQCLRIFGALAHFLIVQLHLADVQLISARYETVTIIIIKIKKTQIIFKITLSIKTLLSHQKTNTKG